MMDDLKERLKVAITSTYGYSEVSKATNINERTLKRYASGETEPSVNIVKNIAKATGKNVIWLLIGETEPEEGTKQATIMAELNTIENEDLETAMNVIKALSLSSSLKKKFA